MIRLLRYSPRERERVSRELFLDLLLSWRRSPLFDARSSSSSSETKGIS